MWRKGLRFNDALCYIVGLVKRAFLYIFALLVSAETIAGPRVLKVGVGFRTNPNYNDTLTSLMNGIELAKTAFERQHPGVVIDLVKARHIDAMAAVAHAAEALANKNVPLVIGGLLSEEAIVLRDQLEPRNIVLVSPTATSPKVTQDHKYVFRSCFSDKDVARAMADYVSKKVAPKGLGVIWNVSSPYTDYLSKQFVEDLGPHQVVHVEKVLKDHLDYSPIIRKYISQNVTHVVMFSHDIDLMRFVDQASRMNFHPVYIGSDGWGTNEFIYETFVQKAPAPKKFVALRNAHWHAESNAKKIRQFRDAYRARFQKTPDDWSALGYDVAWFAFSGLYRAPVKAKADEIAAALRGLSLTDLITTNTFALRDDHSPKKSFHIYRISAKGAKHEVTLQ